MVMLIIHLVTFNECIENVRDVKENDIVMLGLSSVKTSLLQSMTHVISQVATKIGLHSFFMIHVACLRINTSPRFVTCLHNNSFIY